ncbi:sigma 54-interacting transcriptional regulator [Sandaracinus amylolyticus]|uniref:Type IV fimbriae expression regulatory protein PilR n=1 Tax=Sandaracinus amylolyticus TaxID=927083 RepID=A0A0F6YI19_9BACT|nr:sigma 54-interacting transcriptional regulator [Sandaracinus amylolyticus]AKF06501.1 Type IV fimbriae expression regulatory protein PilR [Sandaracinus amylolyticus]
MAKNVPHQSVPTGSVETFPTFGDDATDPTPGLVLVYSRLHRQLPSAVAFVDPLTTIGREADNDLSIPEPAVSRYHAVVERREDGCWLIDKGSTNGTIVNGARTHGARLASQDLVRVGDAVFRFADRGVLSYSAYRLDGSVIAAMRPVRHAIRSQLVGGCQIDLLLERVEKVAKTGLACVIHGESGTGKELLARTIHDASERRGPFQAINCAALPANLIESELFGYRKGAFTGATQDKHGLVRAAHLGTLFLDEIGDMPLEAQAKLLRVLQEREVLPIGATQPERVDVRVVCATHRTLEAEVAAGRFRGDLLARLREFSVRIPPLRERREDLHPLVLHFLKRAGRPEATVTLPFMLGLAQYAWPYNVRELESAVKLAVALSDGHDIDVRHLPETVQHALRQPPAASRPVAQPSLSSPTTQPDRARFAAAAAPSSRLGTPTEAELREILARHRGNIAAVGRELGKERMQVHRWLKRYAIDINDYRG